MEYTIMSNLKQKIICIQVIALQERSILNMHMQSENINEEETTREDGYGRSDFYPFNQPFLDKYYEVIEARKAKSNG